MSSLKIQINKRQKEIQSCQDEIRKLRGYPSDSLVIH